MARNPDLPPPSVYPLAVRCPVPYCDSEPHRKCCNREGYTLAGVHPQRMRAARLAMEEKKKQKE